jgi:hypothetical protein
VMRKLEDVILSRVTGVSVRSCDAPGREKITDFPGKYLHVPTTSLDARCSCMCSDHIIYTHSQIKIIITTHIPTEDLCSTEIHSCFPCQRRILTQVAAACSNIHILSSFTYYRTIQWYIVL